MSKASIQQDQGTQKNVDPSSAIYHIVRDYADSLRSAHVKYASLYLSLSFSSVANSYEEVLQRALAKGFTQQQLHECLDTYHKLNVWVINTDKTKISFVG